MPRAPIQWAKAEPASADADSLKQTVKAKYDLHSGSR